MQKCGLKSLMESVQLPKTLKLLLTAKTTNGQICTKALLKQPKQKDLPKADSSFESGKVYLADGGDLAYVVKEGDDVVSIAIQFSVSPSAITDINELKVTDTVKPGDVLKLPGKAKVDDSYLADGQKTRIVRATDRASEMEAAAKYEKQEDVPEWK